MNSYYNYLWGTLATIMAVHPAALALAKNGHEGFVGSSRTVEDQRPKNYIPRVCNVSQLVPHFPVPLSTGNKAYYFHILD
jgi:hypothetical protein